MPVPTILRAVMNPQSLRSAVPSIEPLESRIAPAIIFVGAPGSGPGGDVEYDEANGPFVNTAAGVLENDPISLVLGGHADVYYIKLNPGDQMAIGAGGSNFITGPSGTGLKGTAIAIFFDANQDQEVQANELTGLSLGNNVKIQVSGTVFGDVIANYNDKTGNIGLSEGAGNAKELPLNTIGFFGASTVEGSIVAGGAIKGINITSSANQILTGSAAHGLTYDFNGTAEDGGDTLNVVPVTGQAGPSISNVTVTDVTKIQAGSGGPGGAGGSITKVTLISDTDGWSILAGDGGAGNSTKTKGGKGGTITNVFANGLDANAGDATENDVIEIKGGKGGDGSGSGAGGKGGAVKQISIGYEIGPRGDIQRSINTVFDSVLVEGGAGGSGRTGGAGGELLTVDVFAAPTLSGNDLELFGGDGGASTQAGGKGGVGGSVKDFDVRHPGTSAESQQARMVVSGGDGGLTTGVQSAGANGGAVEKGVFVGFSISVTGGNGSQGTKGGAGGNVRNILSQDGFAGVRAKNFSIDAGFGGIGSNGKGGNGGLIDLVTVVNPELSQFNINQVVPGAGNGGSSSKGAGGNGGAVSNITVNDVNTLDSSEVTMKIRAGDGGAGGSSSSGGNGGKGGAISGKNVLEGINASLIVNGGNGGAAITKGSGGVGGGVTNISFRGSGIVEGEAAKGTIIAGNGGAGILNGKGGVGGTVSTMSVVTDGNIVLASGTGGSGGATGASGAGGNILNGATLSATGSTIVTAGAAGENGGKAGNGGGISQLNIQALTSIELRSGDGKKGGSGGSIKEIGVSDVSQSKGPDTGLLIVAGAGSANGNTGGAGGSISGVDGFIATTGTTLIQAGKGGDGTAKAGAGGSVSSVTLRGGGGVGAIVNIEAGHAGDATGGKVGAKGGGVKDVGIGLNPIGVDNPTDPFQVKLGTIIQAIAAGDGGDNGAGKGGAGGSVESVRALYNIGVMRGAAFGYSTMGGVFAGAGGGTSDANAGASGSVINVGANSIAAIVAGRLENGDVIQRRNLASAVEGLVLNSTEAATVNGNGTYLNYDTAGVVGAVINPDEVGVAYPTDPQAPIGTPHANTFDPGQYLDNSGDQTFGIGDATNATTDGFVAALKFATNSKMPTSVRPEAVLTLNPETGNVEFIDLNNRNGQVVVIAPIVP